MKLITTLAVCGLLGACAGEPTFGSTESHVESSNRLAVNRLAVNRLAVNRLAVNRLAVNRLAVNGMAIASADVEALAAEEGGLELLSYMVSCALPEGASLAVAGEELRGSLGVAPSWLDAGLDVSGQRWLTACLLARVNYFGIEVRLSMRGANDALTTTAEERAAYPVLEGAFWGNLFGETADKTSCISSYKATAPQVGSLPLRECTVTDAATGRTRCDYTPAGTCEDICEGSQCAGASEVISVYLEAP
ncbi:MAG: hypothetical protein H0T46_25940 [Deltaproteobacteria bacterium]|nr:hypothetical protein [Deltaproteobacteria bacterium]